MVGMIDVLEEWNFESTTMAMDQKVRFTTLLLSWEHFLWSSSFRMSHKLDEVIDPFSVQQIKHGISTPLYVQVDPIGNSFPLPQLF